MLQQDIANHTSFKFWYFKRKKKVDSVGSIFQTTAGMKMGLQGEQNYFWKPFHLLFDEELRFSNYMKPYMVFQLYFVSVIKLLAATRSNDFEYTFCNKHFLILKAKRQNRRLCIKASWSTHACITQTDIRVERGSD